MTHSDVFDDYLSRGDGKSDTGSKERISRGLSGERGKPIPAGTKIRDLEIIGPAKQEGRWSTYWNRQYRVRCIALKQDGGICGKELTVTYGQLYYTAISNCGCKPLAKHPPIRLEGKREGRVEVMRWVPEDGGGWEMVCHECGALMYRTTAREVREAGKSCDGHVPQEFPNQIKLVS